ncbi:MAG: phage holin [Clostridia bacterium]|nr:phage holin [Clostridia bacterium]MDD4798541.1 phage holin [Clostridia bacterium]
MTKGTIIRTIILLMALVNHLLTANGLAPLPFNDEQLEQGFADVFTIVAALIAWWRNNSFTPEAVKADNYLRDLKKGKASE